MSIGKLLAAARIDAAKVAGTGGFNDDIMVSTPDGQTTITVTGLTTGIWVNTDTMGNTVDKDSSHVAIPEQAFIDQGYTVRNQLGKVALKGHLVQVKDNIGTLRNFTVERCEPNVTTGLIMLILGRG